MEIKSMRCCFLFTLFEILFFVHTNESYYMYKRKTTQNHQTPRQKLPFQTDMYFHEPKSDRHYSSPDLHSQETMDVSNSIWSDLDKLQKNDWVDNDFEGNVNGLIDNWIYDNIDYDGASYPPEELRFNQYPINKQIRTSDDLYQQPIVNRRNDIEMTEFYRNPLPIYQPRFANKRSDFSGHVVSLTAKELSELDFNIDDEHLRNYKQRLNQEEKTIISGIDINPFTSNAFSTMRDATIGETYKANKIISGLHSKTNKVKNALDQTVLDIGDSTIGNEHRQRFKDGSNEIVTDIGHLVKAVEDNSINTKSISKAKESLKSLKDKANGEANRQAARLNHKIPEFIQFIKDKAKSMGKFVYKRVKQMVSEKTHPSSPDQTERQGLTLIGSLLTGPSAPVAAMVSAVIFAVAQVAAMGIQASLQVNQSTYEETNAGLPTTTTTADPCNGITCSGKTDTCLGGSCLCGTGSACAAPLSNLCSSGRCKCGSSSACTSGSTLTTCLSSSGATPTSSDTVATCKCTGALTSSDTCIAGTGFIATVPLCGSSTYGTIGVCGKCQKMTDGTGGDGDGLTQGTCQTGTHKCCSTGQCETSC